MKKLLSILLVFSLVCCLFAGCGRPNGSDETISNHNSETSNTGSSNPTTNSDENPTTSPVDVDFSQADEDMFTDRDAKV